MTREPIPQGRWLVDVTFTEGGVSHTQRLALHAQGRAAWDREVAEQMAHDRAWLADHGIDPGAISHIDVTLDDGHQPAAHVPPRAG
jgi:hypothetical protein